MNKCVPIAGFFSVAVFLFFLYGCNKGEDSRDAADTKFELTDRMMDSIKIDTVIEKPVSGELTLSAKISADENKILQIYPTLSGYAEQIKVQLGDYVNQGQLLAVIHSGEIAGYEKQLSDAQSNLNVAEKQLQVEQDLYRSKLSIERNVSDAQGEVNKAQSEINQLKNLFQIYRKGKGDTYNIIAPISGYVIQKNINNGMEIRNDNNQSLFTISEINDVWVIANVFETDIPKVKEDYDAEVTAISYPNRVFQGKIDRVYNFLDPETKTMQVRIRINNNNGLLKPEMFASVKIYYPGNGSMLAIPSSALIFDNNAYHVLVFKNSGNIIIRDVQPGEALGGITYIKDGLQPGERIISHNQLLIYNALLQQ